MGGGGRATLLTLHHLVHRLVLADVDRQVGVHDEVEEPVVDALLGAPGTGVTPDPAVVMHRRRQRQQTADDLVFVEDLFVAEFVVVVLLLLDLDLLLGGVVVSLVVRLVVGRQGVVLGAVLQRVFRERVVLFDGTRLFEFGHRAGMHALCVRVHLIRTLSLLMTH